MSSAEASKAFAETASGCAAALPRYRVPMRIALIVPALLLVACAAETSTTTESEDTSSLVYEGTGTFRCSFTDPYDAAASLTVENLGVAGKAPTMTATMVGEGRPIAIETIANLAIFTAYNGSYSAQVVISREDVYAIKYGTKVPGIVVRSSNHSSGASRTAVATCVSSG
jgi:hypothetical protein